MKKTLVIALALAFVLSIGATAFAASNPFVDVPAKHWAYDAVGKLAKAGIIEGYGDKTFRGDRTMTRYEMAEVVGKAMAKSDKTDASLKALIDKLAVEFASELNTLGVRVAKLEKNASSVKFSGDARIRYQSNFDLRDYKQGPYMAPYNAERFQQRIRLNLEAGLNEKTQFIGRLAAENTSGEGGPTYSSDVPAVSSTGTLRYETAKFVFKNAVGNGDFSIGRDTLYLGQGLLADTDGYFDSVRLTFGGEAFSGFYAYGDISQATGEAFTNNYIWNGGAINVSALNLAWNASENWTVTGAALVSHTEAYPFKVYALGFSGKMNDFTLSGEYAKNRHDYVRDTNEKSAWYASLWYKGAQKSVVGSWGVYVDYRDAGEEAFDGNLTTLNGMATPYDNYNGYAWDGAKGWGVGFNYAVAKNAILTATYEQLKSTDPDYSANYKYKPFIQVKAEMWF